MRIKITSVMVENQDKALKFYTEILGFVKKTEIPAGDYRWLTVISTDERDGVELLLEPLAFEPARTYQKALFEEGIPYTSFNVDDIEEEFARLTDLGVKFRLGPTQMGDAVIAVFDDTCGNFIQLVQI